MVCKGRVIMQGTQSWQCTVKSLWVRIKEQINNEDVIVGVCYRPPSQDDDINELFFEELRDTCKSTVLVLMGDFSLPEINWEHHITGTTQTKRFLKNLYDNFMQQVLRNLSWKDALLDQLLVNKMYLMSKVEIGGCLGHNEHEVSEEALYHNTEDEDSSQGMEPYLVRRLLSRNIQLPPLAFRQLEQAYWDKKNDTETIPRPTTLPLRIPPLIAVTAAESSRLDSNILEKDSLKIIQINNKSKTCWLLWVAIYYTQRLVSSVRDFSAEDLSSVCFEIITTGLMHD
ncbi:hypothetical protein BTVI_03796 [Pitangus sulphuratus]|nr:hypothetical protein BTVI_03796 [Pitangus sulphuratus]